MQSTPPVQKPMTIRAFTVSKFSTNCYVLGCQEESEAIIVDPGFEESQAAEQTFDFIIDNALKPKFIVNTHGHPDHTCGNGLVKEKFNIPILIHRSDAAMLGKTGKNIAEFFGFKNSSPEADILLEDNQTITFGRITLRVMHTPGHSQGSISLAGEKMVITGDTLFAGSIGRTDLPGGSEREMQLSLKKLASLPNNFAVYPGHGPATAIGKEKLNNPFLTPFCRDLPIE
jgi:hydroxyacylglutathione hydrolase